MDSENDAGMGEDYVSPYDTLNEESLDEESVSEDDDDAEEEEEDNEDTSQQQRLQPDDVIHRMNAVVFDLVPQPFAEGAAVAVAVAVLRPYRDANTPAPQQPVITWRLDSAARYHLCAGVLKIFNFCRDLLQKGETASARQVYVHYKDFFLQPRRCDVAIQRACYILGVQKHDLNLR